MILAVVVVPHIDWYRGGDDRDTFEHMANWETPWTTECSMFILLALLLLTPLWLPFLLSLSGVLYFRRGEVENDDVRAMIDFWCCRKY